MKVLYCETIIVIITIIIIIIIIMIIMIKLQGKSISEKNNILVISIANKIEVCCSLSPSLVYPIVEKLMKRCKIFTLAPYTAYC